MLVFSYAADFLVEEAGMSPLPTKFVKYDRKEASKCAIKALAVQPAGGIAINLLIFTNESLSLGKEKIMSEYTENNNGNESSSDFIRSVFTLSSDDIIKEKKKKSPSAFIFDHIRTIVLIVCGAVLVWSLQYIIKSLIHYQKADNIYNDIGNIIMGDNGENGAEAMLASPKTPISPNYSACQELSDNDLNDIITTKPINEKYERIKNKLYSLKELYPDLYGWIELPNTQINYPIMQTDNNDYYLTHSYTGSSLQAGSIFADYRCDSTLMDNYNLVLYGHHMSASNVGSMFHSLDKFLDEDFFRNNNTIYIYTLDGMYTYKVFSVYSTDKYYPYIQTVFTSVNSFVSFAERIAGNSIYQVDNLDFGSSDRLLTLSTCTNLTGDGRLAVHAVLDSYIN